MIGASAIGALPVGRLLVWIGYDHGSNAYAGSQDGAAGNAGDVSTPDAGCSGGDL